VLVVLVLVVRPVVVLRHRPAVPVGLVALAVPVVIRRPVRVRSLAGIPRRSVVLAEPEEMRNQVFAKKLKCFYAM
jgi:hypothetical protein